MKKFLVIQTAFIGDVVLATGIVEKLHAFFPDAEIDFLVRKGNEALLAGHPFLHETLVWDKKKNKLGNLWKMGGLIRKRKYDKVINVQRFAATGLLTVFSGAAETIGFDKNPLSRWFTRSVRHVVSYSIKEKMTVGAAPAHEIDRNQELISAFTDEVPAKPRLYPTQADYAKVLPFKDKPYITISPASVWFTKQYPAEKWSSFLNGVPHGYQVYILGAPSDAILGDTIRQATSHPAVTDLAGKLSFLQSAALMQDAAMNYVNDSAPMHFASSVNAPVTAIYCSTIPAFGFGPLSDIRHIVEVKTPLDCRPCGLHGYKACPLGHFHCGWLIGDDQLIKTLPSM